MNTFKYNIGDFVSIYFDATYYPTDEIHHNLKEDGFYIIGRYKTSNDRNKYIVLYGEHSDSNFAQTAQELDVDFWKNDPSNLNPEMIDSWEEDYTGHNVMYIYEDYISPLEEVKEEIPRYENGCVCIHCKERYEYSQPNRSDGTLLCFGCKDYSWKY